MDSRIVPLSFSRLMPGLVTVVGVLVQQQLQRASAKLQRSNTDLQQFAYVASADRWIRPLQYKRCMRGPRIF